MQRDVASRFEGSREPGLSGAALVGVGKIPTFLADPKNLTCPTREAAETPGSSTGSPAGA
jgi:hypothetical protein